MNDRSKDKQIEYYIDKINNGTLTEDEKEKFKKLISDEGVSLTNNDKLKMFDVMEAMLIVLALSRPDHKIKVPIPIVRDMTSFEYNLFSADGCFMLTLINVEDLKKNVKFEVTLHEKCTETTH